MWLTFKDSWCEGSGYLNTRQDVQRAKIIPSSPEQPTPGRKRAYILYFTAAKQSKTREARVEKCLQNILDGIGLNEQ
jgi:uncharacterized protein YdeI (YjbR/CyaY-like superfamily)